MNELAPPGSGTELERSAERGAGGRMNEPAPLGTAFNPFNRNRAIVISLLALALAGLSFHGGLDNFASAKIDELTKQNLGLLGLAIAIDVVVSFLQTTEISLFFLSGQVGQALDPINDGVERLTDAPAPRHRLSAPAGHPANNHIGSGLQMGVPRDRRHDGNLRPTRTVESRADRLRGKLRRLPCRPRAVSRRSHQDVHRGDSRALHRAGLCDRELARQPVAGGSRDQATTGSA